jgi:hypothetical protein
MKVDEFLSIVPRPVKTAAVTVAGGALLLGLTAAFIRSAGDVEGLARGAALAGVSLLAGAFIAMWVVCLGFVYADARRRAMPPILWTLIAALIPNLLGFLLYFALRRPFALPCASCGRAITAAQPFCSWCGAPCSPVTISH